MTSDHSPSPFSLHDSDIRYRTVSCQALFASRRSSMPDVSDVDWFEYREAEFNLWCKIMKADRKGKSSLEHRVRDHANIRQLYQDLLDGLFESLSDLMKLARLKPSMIAECAGMREHGEADDEASSSSGDSEDGSEIVYQQNDMDKHEVEYHMFYVKATITRLIDLSTKIRQSGNKYRYHKADASLKEGDFIEYVQSWKSSILGSSLEKATAVVPYQTGAIADFLHESRLTIVQRRLIRANLLRRNRIKFVRDSVRDHEESVEEGIAETATKFGPQSTDLGAPGPYLEVGAQALPNDDMPVQASSKTMPSASHTATHIGSQFDLSFFLKEEKSPSIVTRATRIGGRDDLEYPRCPKPPNVDSLLTCPYCANVLPEKCFRSQSLWRKHVANDILPYSCYYEHCAMPDLMWSTSDELMRHLNEYHSQIEWTCPWCTTDLSRKHISNFSSRQAWETHAIEQHQNVADSIELSSLSAICQRRTLEPVSCPLCTHGNDRTQLVDDDHILWHVHEFALKCFPWEDTTEEDEDQSMIDVDLEPVKDRTDNLVLSSLEDGNASFLEESASHSDSSDSNTPHLHPNKSSRQTEMAAKSVIPSTSPEIFGFRYGGASLPTGAGSIPSSPSGRQPPSVFESQPPSPPGGGQQNHLGSEIGLDTEIRNFLDSYLGKLPVPTMPTANSFSEEASWYGHPLDSSPSSPSSLLVESGKDLGELSLPSSNSSRRFSLMDSVNTTANQIRTRRGCMRCRIQRVTCTAEGVCDRCVKAHPQEPQSSCFREDLIVIANNLTQLRFAGLDRTEEIEVKELLRTARPRYSEPKYKGAVVFARGWPQFRLPATLRDYHCLDDMSRQIYSGCIFPREHGGVPSYQDLVKWAEHMVIPEDHDTFEGSIEFFVKMYSAPQRLRQYPRRPQMDLLDMVHTMKCMYKICCQDDFIFIREDTGAVEHLPLAARAELRAIARMALESGERGTLTALDKLKAASTKVPEQDLPALWAALWQLMFIYRDLFRNRASPDNKAGALLNAVAVFYAAHFRTSASLGKLSLDSLQRHWGPGETQQAQLSSAFDHALSLRDTLHRTIAAGNDEIDHRLKALVVDPEMKVLGRRTNKKTSGSK